ncbi:hypothetical protein AA0242T_2790 [Acetobacter aceti NRIC 0242]|uniref:Uncharacterized protein n=1 Tax=Acetobacter aceti NBRC 14818 TaxID=887700 RepID=A0AB33ICH7_ACEAC|nr:hypothetical protein EDC15_13513 [Acetobacter aceti NBRC 14818]BCK74693.1 hypothetical protein EMQ_0299 [Acetobacter aceti NBRC 14818]GAN58784.1 hypothetical protein Abac_067_001 [Acetobacter aceti NBRC 14818]GBO82088.1 hypothetical protein AA0242T_2790 [Acetobacter aceti NRIC 0242]
MMNTSENIFYLIGSDGSRYVPYKKENRKNGKYGYEILPSGYGNDPSRAEYTEDVEQRWTRPFGQFCGLDKLYPVVVMPPF